MLSVTNETKNAFFKDSGHKEILIEFEGLKLEDINCYLGNNFNKNGRTTATLVSGNQYSLSGYYDFGKSNDEKGIRLIDYVDLQYIRSLNYCYVILNLDFILEDRNKKAIDIELKGLSITTYMNGGSTITNYSEEQAKKILLDGEKIIFCYSTSIVNSNSSMAYKVTVDFISNESQSGNYAMQASNVMFMLSNLTASDFVVPNYYPTQIVNGVYPDMSGISPITNGDIVNESFSLTESLCSMDKLKFGLCEASNISLEVANRKEDFKNKTFRAYITANDTDKIPLGRFKTNAVKKRINHNLITKQITAFDEMEEWNADASAWYSKYMFALNLEEDVQASASAKRAWFGKADIDFTRQMLSTYFNFALKNGFEDINDYPLTLEYGAYRSNKLTAYTVFVGDSIKINDVTRRTYYHPYETVIENPDTTKLYLCKKTNHLGLTDAEILENYGYNSDDRGILSNASIMICQELDDGTYNKILVDVDDFFCLSENCKKLYIYYGFDLDFWTTKYRTDIVVVDNLMIYSAPMKDWQRGLINKDIRLVYYDWYKTRYGENTSANSVECTTRDVLRSLFEINGAFCKINRLGNFEVLYAQKGGLYPSENLYPAEDLYPIKGIDRIARSKYISATTEDYISQDYGKIQIVSQNTDEDVINIKTYVGSPNLDSTYIIDDNIFYSNSLVRFNDFKVEGDVTVAPYDPIPEVLAMMEKMYLRIRSTSYTPHTTKAVGMPWMEVGDRINLLTAQDAFESFIFRRTLSGIQILRDTYEASGTDIIEAYKEN